MQPSGNLVADTICRTPEIGLTITDAADAGESTDGSTSTEEEGRVYQAVGSEGIGTFRFGAIWPPSAVMVTSRIRFMNYPIPVSIKPNSKS